MPLMLVHTRGKRRKSKAAGLFLKKHLRTYVSTVNSVNASTGKCNAMQCNTVQYSNQPEHLSIIYAFAYHI